ncbi:hypothetical protein [Bacillus phage vB_BanS-Thrax4]|nr:hypothetical protein [Bacillus phage vB_BanS-Thrax4]
MKKYDDVICYCECELKDLEHMFTIGALSKEKYESYSNYYRNMIKEHEELQRKEENKCSHS